MRWLHDMACWRLSGSTHAISWALQSIWFHTRWWASTILWQRRCGIQVSDVQFSSCHVLPNLRVIYSHCWARVVHNGSRPGLSMLLGLGARGACATMGLGWVLRACAAGAFVVHVLVHMLADWHAISLGCGPRKARLMLPLHGGQARQSCRCTAAFHSGRVVGLSILQTGFQQLAIIGLLARTNCT